MPGTTNWRAVYQAALAHWGAWEIYADAKDDDGNHKSILIAEFLDKNTAQLIAAAPDLYAALENMADLFADVAADQTTEDGWKNEELRDAYYRAEAALIKAGYQP